jgi:hypothetical protein
MTAATTARQTSCSKVLLQNRKVTISRVVKKNNSTPFYGKMMMIMMITTVPTKLKMMGSHGS